MALINTDSSIFQSCGSPARPRPAAVKPRRQNRNAVVSEASERGQRRPVRSHLKMKTKDNDASYPFPRMLFHRLYFYGASITR